MSMLLLNWTIRQDYNKYLNKVKILIFDINKFQGMWQKTENDKFPFLFILSEVDYPRHLLMCCQRVFVQ